MGLRNEPQNCHDVQQLVAAVEHFHNRHLHSINCRLLRGSFTCSAGVALGGTSPLQKDRPSFWKRQGPMMRSGGPLHPAKAVPHGH